MYGFQARSSGRNFPKVAPHTGDLHAVAAAAGRHGGPAAAAAAAAAVSVFVSVVLFPAVSYLSAFDFAL